MVVVMVVIIVMVEMAAMVPLRVAATQAAEQVVARVEIELVPQAVG